MGILFEGWIDWVTVHHRAAKSVGFVTWPDHRFVDIDNLDTPTQRARILVWKLLPSGWVRCCHSRFEVCWQRSRILRSLVSPQNASLFSGVPFAKKSPIFFLARLTCISAAPLITPRCETAFVYCKSNQHSKLAKVVKTVLTKFRFLSKRGGRYQISWYIPINLIFSSKCCNSG